MNENIYITDDLTLWFWGEIETLGEAELTSDTYIEFD